MSSAEMTFFAQRCKVLCCFSYILPLQFMKNIKQGVTVQKDLIVCGILALELEQVLQGRALTVFTIDPAQLGHFLLINKYVERAEQDPKFTIPFLVTPHIFRHSKSTHLIQSGVNLI